MAYSFAKRIVGLDFRGISFGAVTYATWNPADKGTSCTLSNGNLTAAFTTDDMVRSTISKTTGKWYWEVTVNASAGFAMAGGAVAGSVPINNFPGEGTNNYAYYSHNGQMMPSGLFGAVYTVADVIGVALDLDGNTVQYYKNNVAQLGPQPLNDVVLFAMGGSAFGSATITANFGATALTYTPPSGFNAGLYT